MTILVHLGRVRLRVVSLSRNEIESVVVERAFRWHFMERSGHGTDEVMDYLGVCTGFPAVQSGGPVPQYEAVFNTQHDGEIKVSFRPVPAL